MQISESGPLAHGADQFMSFLKDFNGDVEIVGNGSQSLKNNYYDIISLHGGLIGRDSSKRYPKMAPHPSIKRID